MGSTGHMIGCDLNWNGNTKQYLDKQNTQLHGPVTYRILASATKGGVYYAACERVSDHREVFALVQPYKFYGKSYNRELIVKDQDETMGPYDTSCPAKILDLLTEPINNNAKNWRKACRAELASTAAKPDVKVGDTLLFAHKFTFNGNHGQTDTFKVIEWGRKKRFIGIPENGPSFTCRLTRMALNNIDYIVV